MIIPYYSGAVNEYRIYESHAGWKCVSQIDIVPRSSCSISVRNLNRICYHVTGFSGFLISCLYNSRLSKSGIHDDRIGRDRFFAAVTGIQSRNVQQSLSFCSFVDRYIESECDAFTRRQRIRHQSQGLRSTIIAVICGSLTICVYIRCEGHPLRDRIDHGCTFPVSCRISFIGQGDGICHGLADLRLCLIHRLHARMTIGISGINRCDLRCTFLIRLVIGSHDRSVLHFFTVSTGIDHCGDLDLLRLSRSDVAQCNA